MKNYLLSAFSIFILGQSSYATASDIELRQAVRQGVDLLYQGLVPTSECVAGETCPDSVDSEKIVDEALALRNQYNQVIQNYQLTDLKWTRMNNLETVYKFQFSSPIQKPGARSNMVYGYLYKPNLPFGCENTFPGTLLVHHVANDISDEQRMAEFATQAYRGVIMVIYLPNYGPRKEIAGSSYFAGNVLEFKEMLFQSLVDLRIAGEILAHDSMVDQNDLRIGGLSLGAILAAASAGLDHFFHHYFIGLGGGDLAGILSSDKSKLSGVIRDSLQNINWNTDEARRQLAPFDALTWAYTVKEKNFVILNALGDEIINHKNSFEKLVQAYQTNETNNIKTYIHDGRHVPEQKILGLKKMITTYLKVLYRAIQFFGQNQSAEVQQCNIYKP